MDKSLSTYALGFQYEVIPRSSVRLRVTDYEFLPWKLIFSCFKCVIPAIFACIINTIIPIMMWLNLDSLGQNNQPSDWTFLPIDCLFTLTNRLLCPSDCPAVQPIATFQASDFQSQVYSSDCHFIPNNCPCVLADITKRLFTLSKRLFAIRCHQALATFGQAIARWQIQILKFP